MSPFEDISHQSDRQRSVVKRDNRKKFALVLSSGALLLVAFVGAIAVVSYDRDGGKDDNPSTTNRMHTASKYVKEICSSTDYTQTCETTLSQAVKNDTQDPQVLIKGAIDAAFGEVTIAFEHSSLLKSNDSEIRGAMEDCLDLYLNSRDELKRSLEHLVEGGIEKLPRRSGDIRSWLSAVMTFMETCVDGFPEGELKKNLTIAMVKGKEVTSNALAIVGEATNVLSMLDSLPSDPSTKHHHRRRRLLAAEREEIAASLEHDGFPSWIEESERRFLREHNDNANAFDLTPNVTVAQDGSGDFKNISDALAAIPAKYKGRYTIYVKKGIYDEMVNVTKAMANVTMYGDGPKNTIITGNKNFIDGVKTVNTASFVAYGHGFMGLGMCFRNTAGAEKHQAVALRVLSDRSVFVNCHVEGYQDTLYAHAQRQFYRSCLISGTIDFIFGDATAVFQNCLILIRRPLDNQQNIVTAHGRTDHWETTGFVLHRCHVIADKKLLDPSLHPIKSYLARPWKLYSRTIIMESEIDEFISPEGYLAWEGDFALDTLYYAEYNNYGPGANLTGRVKWAGIHVIDRAEASLYTVTNFIDGGQWISKKGVVLPVQLGFYNITVEGTKLIQ